MKIALLTPALLALLCLVEGKKMDKMPKMGMERKSGPVKGRAAEQMPDGGFSVRGKSKKFAFKLLGYAELDASGDEIEQHTSSNVTEIENLPAEDSTLPFSMKSDSSDAITAKCLSAKFTFESGTKVITSCCISKDNGTITLNSGASAEDYDIMPGYTKCSCLVEEHMFCDAAACAGNVGNKIRLDYLIEGPDKNRPQKDTGNRQQGGKKKPKKYRFGVGTLELSTVAAEGADPITSPTWRTLTDDDVTVVEEDGKVKAKFTLPKPSGQSSKIWYDPGLVIEDEDYDDDSAAPQMAATVLTLISSILTFMIMQ